MNQATDARRVDIAGDERGHVLDVARFAVDDDSALLLRLHELELFSQIGHEVFTADRDSAGDD